MKRCHDKSLQIHKSTATKVMVDAAGDSFQHVCCNISWKNVTKKIKFSHDIAFCCWCLLDVLKLWYCELFFAQRQLVCCYSHPPPPPPPHLVKFATSARHSFWWGTWPEAAAPCSQAQERAHTDVQPGSGARSRVCSSDVNLLLLALTPLTCGRQLAVRAAGPIGS